MKYRSRGQPKKWGHSWETKIYREWKGKQLIQREHKLRISLNFLTIRSYKMFLQKWTGSSCWQVTKNTSGKLFLGHPVRVSIFEYTSIQLIGLVSTTSQKFGNAHKLTNRALYVSHKTSKYPNTTAPLFDKMNIEIYHARVLCG